MNNDTIVKRVEAYFARATKEPKLAMPTLSKRDLYQTHSGSQSEWGERTTGEIYRGTFLDAVIALVQRSDYGGWWSDPAATVQGNGFLSLYRPTIVSVAAAPDLRGIIRDHERYLRKLENCR